MHEDAPSDGLQWTGERCVPWAPDIQVIYEHLHRYHFAAQWATGRRVLDLACGEGYGSRILSAAGAKHVHGVDIDEPTIRHARAGYADESITFATGDMRSLDEPGTYDLIICFEALEHVAEHAALLANVTSMLTEDGIFITSTPDRERYSDELNRANPFHVRELNQQEFRTLLDQHFGHVNLYGQVAAAGSHLWPVGTDPSDTPVLARLFRDEHGWHGAGNLRPTYFVGVASNAPIEPPAVNALLDEEITIAAVERELAERRGLDTQRMEDELQGIRRELDTSREDATAAHAHASSLLQELATQKAEVAEQLQGIRRELDTSREDATAAHAHASSLLQELATQKAEVAEQLQGIRRELDTSREDATAAHAHASSLLQEIATLDSESDVIHATLRRTRLQVAYLAEQASRRAQDLAHAEAARAQAASAVREADDRLATMQNSAMWRTGGLFRTWVERTAPATTRRRKAYATLTQRLTGGLAANARTATPTAGGPVEQRLILPTSEEPLASVVIPVYGQWDVTYRCLRSIAAAGCLYPFEVLLVDDASPDDTLERLSTCVQGARVIPLSRNVGYLRATNSGAAQARGEFLVLLNNDTVVAPEWLDQLIETAVNDASVGLVGALQLCPDGSISEAGGIVFKDGTGWNYGRGHDPGDHRYRYLREVDYCSAAAVLVRQSVWEAVGGFDERYAPAYYEDTDLAFATRGKGMRTVLQPAAVVVHAEGTTHGNEVASGVKRFQEINRIAFVAKWGHELENQPPTSSRERIDSVARRDAYRGSILVVDHRIPMPDQDSGSMRMYAILLLLLELGYAVSFLPADERAPEPYASRLRRKGVDVITGESLETWLRREGSALSAAVLSRATVAWHHLITVREHAPRAHVIFDTVDLHFVREGRRGKLSGITDAGVSNTYQELETSLCRISDSTFVVSDVERDAIAALVPAARVHVVPNVHARRPAAAGPANRRDLLFVGGYSHPPNVDAVLWFAEEVLPLIHAHDPTIRFCVVGSNVPPSIAALDSSDIRVLGYVPDLGELHRSHRAFVAPLRYGAGIKGKLGESLSYGLPAVTTTIGGEGMGLEHGIHALVADRAADFAAAVMRLYTEPELWTRIAENGRRHIGERYSPEAVRGSLSDFFADALRVPSHVPLHNNAQLPALSRLDDMPDQEPTRQKRRAR